MISSLYGGRLAEELIYGVDKVSTGASNDIERATDIARKMVTQWGFSDALGPLLYAEDQGDPFSGHGGSHQSKHVSPETLKLIDAEIRTIIDRNYARARQILEDNMDIMHAMKDALMTFETIDAGQIDDLMERKTEIREPQGWGDDNQTKPQEKNEKPVNEEESKVEENPEDEKPQEPEDTKKDSDSSEK
jgi:cell division protease FtsH